MKLNPLKQFFNCIIDFIYPKICPLCAMKIEENGQFCPQCMDRLVDSMTVTVNRGKQDFQHLVGEIHFDEVLICWNYTTDMEKLLHMVKYQRGKRLGRLLGIKAGEALKKYFEGWNDSVMVPVPLHKIRHRERGYNQSEILSQGLAEHIPLTIESKILVRHRKTLSQTLLPIQERQKNVEGAFNVIEPNFFKGKRVLLVDDVCTSGSTLNSCAYSLKNAGVEGIVCVALARPLLK